MDSPSAPSVDSQDSQPLRRSTWWLDRFVIGSDAKVKQVWNIVIIILLILTATVFPFKLCFMDFQIFASEEEELEAASRQDMGWIIFESIMDVCFWIDLVLNFFFAIPDEDGFEVVDQRKIFCAYVRGFFLLDLIACLPTQLFELMMGGDSKGTNKSLRLLRLGKVGRLVRLSRLSRLLKLLKVLGKSRRLDAMSNWRIARMAKFTIALLCSVHLLACGWYLQASFQDTRTTWVGRRGVGKGESEDLLRQPPVVQWLNSLYWIMMVFTTVGFGDIYAVSPAELVYASFVMLFGVILQGIIVSRMIGVVTAVDDEKVQTFQACKVIKSFSRHVGLPTQFHDQLIHHVKHPSKKNRKEVKFDKHAMWQLLQTNYFPRELVGMLPQLVFEGSFWKNRIFRDSRQQDPQLILLLTIHTSRTTVTKGEKVYAYGDHPISVILVEHGTFAAVAKPTKDGGKHDPELDNKQVFALMSSTKSKSWRNIVKGADKKQHLEDWPYVLYSLGSFFGEWEIIYPSARRATVRCESDCSETMEVSRSAFVSALSEFPHFLENLRRSSTRQETRRLRRLERFTQPGIDYLTLAAVTMQRHFRGKLERKNFELRKKQLGLSSPSHPETPLKASIARTHSNLSESHQSHNGVDAADSPHGLIKRKSSFKQTEEQGKIGAASSSQRGLEAALKPLQEELNEMRTRHSVAVQGLAKSQEETMRMLHQVYLEVLR